MTAAHRELPLGTKVIVENQETGDVTEVKITDRGPYADPKRRIIDLSRAAADSISLVECGVGPVRITISELPPETQQTGKTQTDKEALDYEVQVGAFTDYEQAQRVIEQMPQRYLSAYIAPRDGPSGPLYRVWIGPFDTEERAKKVAQALKREGHRIFLDEVLE
jgi:rare lipoprotein A